MEDGAQEEPAAPATPATPADPVEERRKRARMLTYRLVPLWFFLVTFGFLVAWEFGLRQTPATVERLQATVIISLVVAFLIGAPVGIRFFNPVPPKT